MFDTLYPAGQRRLFTNRRRELNRLNYLAEELTHGQPVRLGLFGPRRIGKSWLIKEFIHRHRVATTVVPAYVNFENICTDPENFALKYVGWVTFWLLTRGDGRIEDFLDPSRLLVQASEYRALQNELLEIERVLGSTDVNRNTLLNLAFAFPEKVARSLGVKLLLFLDEFQDLADLSAYKGARNVVGVFRAHTDTENVGYVLAGSLVSAMRRLIADAGSPLFLQFDQHALTPFTREDTDELTRKIIPDVIDHSILGAVYRYSSGYPYYIVQIVRRMRLLHRLDDLPLDEDLVKQAFMVETLAPTGGIHNHCRYVYDVSLEKATRYAALKSVLTVLAVEEELNQSQVARRLRIAQGTARNYLNTLVEIGLVTQRAGRYYYQDPVLRYWVASVERGIEIDEFPRRSDVLGLIARLDEQFQRASTELGQAKEAEVRELLRRFNGQEVDGALLGLSDTIHLPIFRRVESYCSPDGRVELDGLAEADDGTTRWAVEVKWRAKRGGVAEVNRLQEKACGVEAVGWLISRSGFTPAAIARAREAGMMLSTAEDLAQLARLLYQQFPA